ncbi:glycerol kinase GlpK [Caproiciproducens sp. NJN-50]|uniref:FGGY-family carbohydrate kinase n=1 Tax=Acutalibacteraceae TaxID=3082771 RepID=UPI000FFE0E21|nr:MULTISPECIES: glycerol kinase [Acutalibacteraceae]QAT49490.1 glycerol kinase GlpK [Caproiciproducens sp. NJN-50]
MDKYILAVDQSTQGTKGLLFDGDGHLIARCDRAHAQIVNDRGWVEHDPEEIYVNTLAAVRDVAEKAGIAKEQILAVGISNQRETALAWDRASGKPVYNAIVWQCARGAGICRRLDTGDFAQRVKQATGLPLSPYFSAAKLAWILENVQDAKRKAAEGSLCMGTVDSWLVYRLTGGRAFKTDYSNASRTQLFNISSLRWDEELCRAFGIPKHCLAQVCGSDSVFGETDFEGFLPRPVPICGVLGDSHGALFGQGCLRPGMVKATYGTGSSVMMNIGSRPVFGKDVVTSLAWGMDGKVDYVLEGNINYTGAVISWLKNDLHLIQSAAEAQSLAEKANPDDRTYLVPAFTGLGAPYWDSAATAVMTGMTRTTGKAEVVRAAENCIAYQITDIVESMRGQSGLPITELRADGGPTGDGYLMQFQSDLIGLPVRIPGLQELSGMGAAFTAGISAGLYDGEKIFDRAYLTEYRSKMPAAERERLLSGWKQAVALALHHEVKHRAIPC